MAVLPHSLQEGFSRKLAVGRLSAKVKPQLVAEHVLSDIEGQVKSMQVYTVAFII